MIDPEIHNFHPGGLGDRPDSRDYLWSEIAMGAVPFDWSKGFDIEVELQTILNNINFRIPIKDQNGSGSCGGQAWSYYAGSLEAVATKTYEERSAKYIYSQTFVPNGGGSYGRDNASILKNQGVAQESLTASYDNGQPPNEAFITRPQDITEDARANANHARSLLYANVNYDIDSIAQAAQANHGAVIGLIGKNNGSWLGVYPVAPDNTAGIWGHWLYVGKARVVDGIKYLGVCNSWGTNVGDHGWQYLSEDYIKKSFELQPLISTCWTHVYDTSVHFAALTKTLKPGMIDPQVIVLQKMLNSDLATQLSSQGPGSPGNETHSYGSLTVDAVMRFQKKYGIVSSGAPTTTGYGQVGPITRNKLNKIYA